MEDKFDNVSASDECSGKYDLSRAKMLEEFPDTKPLVIVESNGNILYSNISFERVFKLKSGNNFSELNSEPDITAIIDGLSRSNYSSFHFELYLPSEDELITLFYFSEIERIYINQNEYFVIVLSSLEDKRKLENKINNLHNALEYGNIPVIITDASGRITYSTKSFEKILDTSIELLYNKPVTGVFSKFYMEQELKNIEDNIINGRGCVTLISDIDEDGKVWYKELRITPAVKTEDESVFIITANDITDYILNTRIIQKSEQRQKSIINNISDLLVILRGVSDNFIFENANDNFYEIFLIDRVRALNKNIKEVFDKPFRNTLIENIMLLNDSKNPSREFRYKNYLINREYLGSISFTDDHYANERIYIISLKDITEQLMNEEKLRKAYERETHVNKLKNSFLANMSHEIRTPLNAMIGYTELIEDDVKNGDNEAALEMFGFLREGYARFLNLVNNIVEMTLIQSGETELDMKNIEINSIIRKVYGKYTEVAFLKNIKFILYAFNDIFLFADQLKLEKVFSSLVDNAIKYTESFGKVLITTSTEEDLVKIVISDTGKGIKKNELQRMLEPFSQEDEGHKREYEGAGLGLTIAYNLTKLMGGEFVVDSEKDKGTIITLIFPAVK